MTLVQVNLRIEKRQLLELRKQAGVRNVSPLLRSILDEWVDIDGPRQREILLNELKELEGRIKLVNMHIHHIDTLEEERIADEAAKSSRTQYLEDHPEIIDMFINKTISPKGYLVLREKLSFANKTQVNKWITSLLDQQTQDHPGGNTDHDQNEQ